MGAVMVVVREGENLCWRWPRRWSVVGKEGEGWKGVDGMNECYQGENQG